MIAFSKYHGCGNSFVIVAYEMVKAYDLSNLAIQMCNRDVGIGADGFIVVKTKPLEMVFYNQDGSIAPMCGNGIRCFANYVKDKQLEHRDIFDVITGAGILRVACEANTYEISMGYPVFDSKMLHLSKPVDVHQYEIAGFDVSSVFIGTVHTVLFVEDVDRYDVAGVGETLCNHPMFKEKSNINFVEVMDQENIKVRTYERGVGITKACGTGCCASFIYSCYFHKTTDQVKVHLELGTLQIRVEDEEIIMRGPSTFIVDGYYNVKEEQGC